MSLSYCSFLVYVLWSVKSLLCLYRRVSCENLSCRLCLRFGVYRSLALCVCLSRVVVFRLPSVSTCSPPCVSLHVSPVSRVRPCLLSPACLVSRPLGVSHFLSLSLHVSSPLTVCVSSHCLPSLSWSHVHSFLPARVMLHVLVCVLVCFLFYFDSLLSCVQCVLVCFLPVSSRLIRPSCVPRVFLLLLITLVCVCVCIYIVSGSSSLLSSYSSSLSMSKFLVSCSWFMFKVPCV